MGDGTELQWQIIDRLLEPRAARRLFDALEAYSVRHGALP